MSHPSTPDFDQLLAAGAAWLLLGCGGWAVAICAAAVLEVATGGRLQATAWVGCPPVLRPHLLAALGVALAGVPVLAGAGTAASRAHDGPSHSRASRQQPLPAPARPLGPAPKAETPAVAAPAAPSAVPRQVVRVVVRPGDTLWHLAELRLASSAPAGRVAELVARVHRRNREVIGADPDLIRPGQHLTLPALPRVRRPSHAEPTPRGEP